MDWPKSPLVHISSLSSSLDISFASIELSLYSRPQTCQVSEVDHGYCCNVSRSSLTPSPGALVTTLIAPPPAQAVQLSRRLAIRHSSSHLPIRPLLLFVLCALLLLLHLCQTRTAAPQHSGKDPASSPNQSNIAPVLTNRADPQSHRRIDLCRTLNLHHSHQFVASYALSIKRTGRPVSNFDRKPLMTWDCSLDSAQ
jgi:hypothetical protein